ncbi:MAG: DUF1549 domain-containing protein [Planctomyces sp.]|nr:DUF1549 domain-containing protein [Planctomyces sp.]
MTLRCLPLCVILLLGEVSAQAADPLHLEIDRVLAGASVNVEAPACDDAEFLRRVSLDLTGSPPTLDELQAFLKDRSDDKRVRAVDRLLASPLSDRHIATFLDVMLMERRAHPHIPAEEWQAWLLQSVRENKPYNQLAREVLSADGSEPGKRAAARFYLDREGEPNLITKDVARIFFGRDLQCAQCHDHPLVSDYLQTDYHGLLAFFGASSNQAVQVGDAQVQHYVERSAVDASFESVFIKGTRHITGPKVPGEAEITEPMFPPGEEYEVRPAENVRPVPKFSRRARLAELATSGTNRAFNENIANRLWAHMLGRGLVAPLDLHHADNPPTHPELMRLLGERFAETNFNIRGFLREISLTDVYQRSIEPPDVQQASVAEAAELETPLSEKRTELEARVEERVAASQAALSAWAEAEAALLPVIAEREAARGKSQDAVKKLDEALKAAREAAAQVNAKQAAIAAVNEANEKAQVVVQKLPQDQELVAAAAKFAERLASLTAELEPLSTAAAEKSAAVEPVRAELQTTHPEFLAAQDKVAPLAETCRQKYAEFLAARVAASEAETELAGIVRRLETARGLVALQALRDAIVAAEQQIPDAAAAAEAAQARRTELTGVVTAADAAHQAAVRAVADAATAHEAALTELAARESAAADVAGAVSASQTALERLPGDEAVALAVETLRVRHGQLSESIAQQEQQAQAAADAEQAAEDRLIAARTAFEAAVAEQARRSVAAEQATAAAEAAQSAAVAAKTELATAVSELEDRLTQSASIGVLKPLTPEQLCLAIFRVTGVYDSYRLAEQTELDNSAPLSGEDRQDPAKVLARERELEQRVYDKLLKSYNAGYVNLYAAGPGQPQGDFFASAEQALYTANGGSILSWAGGNGSIAGQVTNEADLRRAAEILYLRVLSRSPTETEIQDVADYLTARGEQKAAAAQELIWGLIASVEFRFNH